MQQPVEPSSLLREHGVQVTAQRVAVLRAVLDHPHTTADEIADIVRSEIGAVSRQTVYDGLAVLAETGLIRRIQLGGSAARFETQTHDHHHHLVCRRCGEMLDVDGGLDQTPRLDSANRAGYLIHQTEVVHWGICPECQATATNQTQPGEARQARP